MPLPARAYSRARGRLRRALGGGKTLGRCAPERALAEDGAAAAADGPLELVGQAVALPEDVPLDTSVQVRPVAFHASQRSRRPDRRHAAEGGLEGRLSSSAHEARARPG